VVVTTIFSHSIGVEIIQESKALTDFVDNECIRYDELFEDEDIAEAHGIRYSDIQEEPLDSPHFSFDFKEFS